VQVYKQRSEQYGPIYKETFGDISTVVISDLDEYDKVIAVDGRYPNRIELEPIVHYRNDTARSRYKVIPRWNSRSRKREGPLGGGGVVRAGSMRYLSSDVQRCVSTERTESAVANHGKIILYTTARSVAWGSAPSTGHYRCT